LSFSMSIGLDASGTKAFSSLELTTEPTMGIKGTHRAAKAEPTRFFVFSLLTPLHSTDKLILNEVRNLCNDMVGRVILREKCNHDSIRSLLTHLWGKHYADTERDIYIIEYCSTHTADDMLLLEIHRLCRGMVGCLSKAGLIECVPLQTQTYALVFRKRKRLF